MLVLTSYYHIRQPLFKLQWPPPCTFMPGPGVGWGCRPFSCCSPTVFPFLTDSAYPMPSPLETVPSLTPLTTPSPAGTLTWIPVSTVFLAIFLSFSNAYNTSVREALLCPFLRIGKLRLKV